ncbi:MAG: peptide deformylase [Candidatus Peregrinibacteria bacterium]
MAVLPIQTGKDNPILRTKAARTRGATKEVLKLLRDLADTLENVGGLGLAAPQVSVSLRVCLATFNGKLHPMIDPEITWYGSETDSAEEGCLSLPDLTVSVTRPTEIVVKYTDGKGKPQERKLSGFDARVTQHEMDHLDAKLIVDYQQRIQDPGSK